VISPRAHMWIIVGCTIVFLVCVCVSVALPEP
jgi:hypothetical protein